MPKIIKIFLIFILAFFIFETIISPPINAQGIIALENGVRIIIKEDHRNPLVVFSVFIDIGSAHEREYLGSGISHLVEHMLFKGTKKYPNIENILHIYGGKIEGFTSYDYTGFRITILKEHTDVAVDVLKEMLSLPLFRKNDLAKEKEVIRREMDFAEDEPGTKNSRLTFSNAYIRHPYRIPVIGYKENFNRLQRKDLLSFFNSNYTAEHIVMAVVGDMETESMLNKIKNAFGKIPRGRNAYSVLPEEPAQITERYAEEKKDLEGAYLNISFHSTPLLSKNLYAMDILSFVLGQGEGSRLNKRMRIKEERLLAVSAYNYTPKEPGLFVISSVLKEENINAAIDGILNEIDAVKENGIKEEELQKVKNNFIAQYVYQKETIESQANDLALGVILAGDPLFFEKYTENIKSVSLDDVQSAAKRYLKREGMIVTALTRSGSTLKRSQIAIFSKKERDIKKIVLENGLTVLVSENPTLPIMSISLVAKAGLRVESEKNNGTSNLMSLMFMDGTSSMTREEIVDFYESKGMALNSFSGNNSIGVSINCLRENMEDALRLASDICLNPVFPEKEFEREKREISAAINMQDNEIFSHGHRLLREQLFKIHPYRFQTIGSTETIGKIGRGDLLNFYKNTILAENMVLGISGSFTVDEITPLVRKYFGGIPAKGAWLASPEKERPIDKTRELRIGIQKDQSLVLLGFHGIDVYTKERYTIEVMMDLISSESGILLEKIREENGLSYATGAFHVLGIDPGYIVIYALTSKENIEKVKNIILAETSSFIKNGATTQQIQKAKNHLKAIRQMEMQTNSSFIFTVSMDELYGLGCDNYKNYDKNIDGITKEDIKRVASTFLTLDRCAIVILEGK
jgi:zinc protease